MLDSKVFNRGELPILVSLIVLAIIRGIIYIAVFPPWFAPDEATHFEAIRLIGQEGLWPIEEVYLTTPMHRQMRASFEQFHIWQLARLASPPDWSKFGDPSGDLYIYYYPAQNGGGVVLAGNYPLVYQLLLAPVLAWLKPLDIVQQLYILRFFSLVLMILNVVIGWFFTRTIFPGNKEYAIGLTSFLVFLPMYLHTNTSVASDVLVTSLVFLYFLLLVRVMRRPSFWQLILLAGVLGLAIFSKPTGLFIVPTTGIALLVYLAHRLRWKNWWLALALVLALVVTFVGGLLFFNATEGGRNIAALATNDNQNSLASVTDYMAPETLRLYLHTIRLGFLSFWGLFGWADVPIPFAWVKILWLVCLLTGLGVTLFLAEQIINLRRRSCLTPYQKKILVILLFGLIFALISLYMPTIATLSVKWGPPSRYFFPALLPCALYFFIGFRQIFPPSTRFLALPVWLAGLICLDSLTLFGVLIPYLYG